MPQSTARWCSSGLSVFLAYHSAPIDERITVISVSVCACVCLTAIVVGTLCIPERASHYRHHVRSRVHNKERVPQTRTLNDRDFIIHMLYRNTY